MIVQKHVTKTDTRKHLYDAEEPTKPTERMTQTSGLT